MFKYGDLVRINRKNEWGEPSTKRYSVVDWVPGKLPAVSGKQLQVVYRDKYGYVRSKPYYLGVVTDMTAVYEAKYRNGDEILNAVIGKILCAIERCEEGTTMFYTKESIQGLKIALVIIGVVAKNAGLLTGWKDYKLSELFKEVNGNE